MITETREIFTCEFCRKYYKKKSFALAHENKCYKNPKNIHKCTHGDCRYLVKAAVEYGDEGNIRSHFSCKYYANTELYSSIAESKPYLMESIQNGDDGYRRRMPVECTFYESSSDIFQNLDTHNELFKRKQYNNNRKKSHNQFEG